MIPGVVKTGPGSGGKSWLGLDKRLSRANEQCRKPRDARVLLESKMAERMSLSVGVEGGWVEMMPRDARRTRKRCDARFRIWRQVDFRLAGLGKGKGNGCITLSAFHLAPCRPLIMDAKPNSCPPKCLGRSAASRRVSRHGLVTVTFY